MTKDWRIPEQPDPEVDRQRAERAARWNLDGRFIYRNSHGAVGYVDDKDSNPGLLEVIKFYGPDAPMTALKVHASLTNFAEAIAPKPKPAPTLAADMAAAAAALDAAAAKHTSKAEMYRELARIMRSGLSTINEEASQ